jgi:hypothetical protein
MKLIIAGSRGIKDYDFVCHCINEALIELGVTVADIECVISGKEKTGVDALGERWAAQHRIPIVGKPPDWKHHGRSAGPRRNEEMAKEAGAWPAGASVVVRRDMSKGSTSMVNLSKKHGLRCVIFDI